MKRTFIITVLLCVATCITFAQKQQSLIFQVEGLSRPERILPVKSYNEICKSLIVKESGISEYGLKKDSIDFPFNIIAKNTIESELVNFGYHSFFDGMYSAYAEHRPFVISPDMIWLLISQGFAQHVNANPENLRHYFVNFSEKTQLIVQTNTELSQISEKQWEEIFPEFTKQIALQTGNELINALTSDFSTTTPVEKIASEITIMQAMKPYFEYIVMYIVCGIPEITLQGTTEDWEKILEKTQQLSKYDLKWWTKELEPILKKIIATSKGEIDKNFWRNMFKYHSQKKYGAPKIVDGWIVKFFPYDKEGNRNNLKTLGGTAEKAKLPEEIVKVDLHYIDIHTNKQIPLELWAGFVGLEQNEKDFTLMPKIGWLIRKKDVTNEGQKKSFEISKHYIDISVSNFPEALLHLDSIGTLKVRFTDKIIIPNELSNVVITDLILSGKIDNTGIERLKQMFPNSGLIINKETIFRRKGNGGF
ncbi:MAG: DUF4419 domain-containing protein [Lentimicrobiaceae bacterium]|nr:DUF4419 domain-containing protein [Lentimicrobiaceae bacterium]